MTVHTLMDLRFRADAMDEATKMLHNILIDTRAFDGCLGVDALVDLDDPAHVVLFESWASPEHNAAYMAWRDGEGATPQLGAVLAGAPGATRCAKSDEI
jgi:heme oxygenase (mycobilin-producing)